MKNLFFAILPLLLFASSGCKKYVPAPEAFFLQPSYVNVAVTSASAQGTSNHKITDLFLYVDGKFQGVYQPNVKMPIVTRGQNVKINIFAGIKNNGISETVVTWLFYNKIEFDTLVPNGTTVERGLTFTYNPAVTFMWIEDFDGFGVGLVKSPITAASSSLNLVNNSNSFEGRSAMFELNGEVVAMYESAISYPIPHANPNVYLEVNYKCDVELEVGLTDGVETKPCINLNPKTEWNKIYLSLADAVNRQPLSNNYKIYFKANNPNLSNNVRVWLDNIKLIYF